MSKARCAVTSYDSPVDAELALWPGVTAKREVRGKHYALVLAYRGQSRFVIYPSSPGDSARGALNHIRDVRAELRDLGAVRIKPQPAPEVRRGRRVARRPQAEPVYREPFKTRLSENPFDKLAAIRFEAPKPEPRAEAFFGRIWRWIKDISTPQPKAKRNAE